ncbi:MAG TPA: right-handed parallel beta-helix repeat-containing protein [Anaerolineaceae bacterium]|nr:right-handed parallel beta-helix repeat-containing protein [Anaerolineaceae bacterium]
MSTLSRRTFLRNACSFAAGLGAQALTSRIPRTSAQGGPIYLPLILKSKGPIQVGPTRLYKTPSAAKAAARDGDVIEIDPGLYTGDTIVWTQNNLTLRGVSGRAHLDLTGGTIPNQKAIWVIQGRDTTVENIEFSGASVPDQNGAGIRQEGANLTLRNCYFHHNQDGILTGADASSEILIEFCEFAYNGHSGGYWHNLYIGGVKKFTLQFCYTHNAIDGHLVKSRALENHILCNRIMDEVDGIASYEIDIPDGGATYIVGNLIQQSPVTHNSAIVTYAEESRNNPVQALYVVNNTIVNDRVNGVFINAPYSPPSSLVVNNLFIGSGTRIAGSLTAHHNRDGALSDLINPAAYDYHLASGSPAINAGTNPGVMNGYDLAPAWEYVHPLSCIARTTSGTTDIGAYEFHA